MQQSDRQRIEDVIKSNTEKVSVAELAKRNRSVRVISGEKTLALIEAIVDRVIAQRSGEMAAGERAQIVKEAEERIRTASLLQNQTENLVNQLQTEVKKLRGQIKHLMERDKELVGALRRREKRLGRMRETIHSYDAEITRLAKQIQHDAKLIARLEAQEPAAPPAEVDSLRAEITELKSFLVERDQKAGSELEGRFKENLDQTLDKISRTLEAATARPIDSHIEATDVLVAKVFDDEGEMDTNLGRLDVRVSSAEKVSDTLDRLRRLRAKALDGDDEETSEGEEAST